MKRLLFLIAFLALAVPALAQTTVPDEPMMSLKRLSFAVGANYVWHTAADSDENLPRWPKEWEAGFYGAYSLTPHVSAIGAVEYGVDNKTFRSRLGVRYVIFKGN